MLAEAVKSFKEHRLLEGKRCIVGEWVEALSDEDKVAFTETIDDVMMTTRDLHQICRSVGATFSTESVRRHRTQECACR